MNGHGILLNPRQLVIQSLYLITTVMAFHSLVICAKPFKTFDSGHFVRKLTSAISRPPDHYHKVVSRKKRSTGSFTIASEPWNNVKTEFNDLYLHRLLSPVTILKSTDPSRFKATTPTGIRDNIDVLLQIITPTEMENSVYNDDDVNRLSLLIGCIELFIAKGEQLMNTDIDVVWFDQWFRKTISLYVWLLKLSLSAAVVEMSGSGSSGSEGAIGGVDTSTSNPSIPTPTLEKIKAYVNGFKLL